MIRPLAALAFLALGLAAGAAAAEEPYLDDRSTPEALVRSLYNAVNRKEYARAYSYFSPSPGTDLDTYREGFAGTTHVELATGKATAEGAAGSVYYSLPVAIRAVQDDGTEKVFAGCYTLRLANPQIQDEDFMPLHIEKGTLAPAEGPLGKALPKACDD